MEQTISERRSSSSSVSKLVSVRRILMLLLFIGLVAGFHAYIAWRVVDGGGLSDGAAVAGYVSFVLLFASIPAGFAAGRRGPRWLARALQWISHIWIGLFAVTLSALAATELVRGIWTGARGPTPWTSSWTLAALAAAAATASWGFAVARGRPRVRRMTVPIRGLGEGLGGVRIVQISDLHIGQPMLDRHYLARLVRQVNALEPDIVAVTGDLVDGTVDPMHEEVAPLAGLRARLGVFYVTGNHEYYYGGPAWEAEVRRLGLTVLRNEHRIVERDGARLAIAGVSDHDAGYFGREHASRPDLALDGVPADVPRVLLAHQPRTALGLDRERVDLQLSGHTHGGQIFPFMFFVRLQQPVVAGMRTVNGVRVYTHRGTGYWVPPMRVGPAPEIAVLTLTPNA
jgi:predicted MPP superfamily phosphohydrolase